MFQKNNYRKFIFASIFKSFFLLIILLKLFKKFQVTTEQEDYAKGFEEALKNLQNNDSHPQPSQQQQQQQSSNVSVIKAPTMSGGGITGYSEAENANLMLQQIKEEPAPLSPQQNLNPIDMETQEKIKLERKRQRNRVAASKCRKRKLERISKLEDRVKLLKVENHELGSVLLNLKNHVFELKQQVIQHHNAGCHITIKN